MKVSKIIFFIVFVSCGLHVQAQHVAYKSFPHYNEKVAEYQNMRAIDSTDIVMLGNSLTEYAGDWNILLGWKHLRNRGIAGDDAVGIYERLGQILHGKPRAIFLMVGINDIGDGLSSNVVAERAEMVINKIRKESPTTKLFVQSILPINESFDVWPKLKGKSDNVVAVNHLVRAYCNQRKIAYINLFPSFVRHGTNQIRKELTSDGLHLTPFGYKIWAFELKKYLLELK